MKVACTADWHIHQFQDFSKQISVKWDNSCKRFIKNLYGKPMNSRLFNILDGICDLRSYCTKNNIYYVLNAGDIFHKRGTLNVETFNAAYKVIESFKDVNIQLIAIAGNHDQVDSSVNPSTSIHTLQKIITVVEEPFIVNVDSLKIYCVPYNKDKDLVLKAINQFIKNCDSENNILLTHLGVTGGVVGSGMYSLTDEYTIEDLHSDKWKYVVLGHYHRPQLLSANTFYCGTPIQNSFNDELPISEHNGYNGFFVIDLNEDTVKFVPIVKPRFITVNNVEDILDEENYYRIKINSQNSESDEIENLGKNVRVEIEKNYKELPRSTIGLADDFQSAVKKYVKEKQPDSQTLESLGLKILTEALIGGEQ